MFSSRWIGLGLAFLVGALTPPLMLMIAGFGGLFGVDAVATPPHIEEAIAHAVLEHNLAQQAAAYKNPLAGSDQDLLAGMKLFRQNCAGCHGDARAPSPWGS